MNTHYTITVDDFNGWRQAARALLLAGVAPHDVTWTVERQTGLFNTPLPDLTEPARRFTVPRVFLCLAEDVACFRELHKWALLYRVLWRIAQGERHLLNVTADPDVCRLRAMEKAVHRDSHKMKAFVRFRQLSGVENRFIAWHQPTHRVVKRTAPFFARRFATMTWSILTPDASAHWDEKTKTLRFGPGLPRSSAPDHDDIEQLWRVFYRHIFNPARLKVNAMKAEMPVKYWHTLPEAALIPDLLSGRPK